jgi:hypothetical protein
MRLEIIEGKCVSSMKKEFFEYFWLRMRVLIGQIIIIIIIIINIIIKQTHQMAKKQGSITNCNNHVLE